MDKVYVKCKKDDVINRFNQIHTITLYCPLKDDGIKMFYNILYSYSNLRSSISDEYIFKDIDVSDAFCILKGMMSNPMMTSFFSNVNFDILKFLCSCLGSFKRLKYVNFNFTEDDAIFGAYKKMNYESISKGIIGIPTEVYKVEVIEMHFGEMFNQDVIDILNKCMIFNDILSNETLKRKYTVYFEYDDYGSYMDMVVNNNQDKFNYMNPDILDCLRLFPSIFAYMKPIIKIVTNYREL